ncbi:hypothetical protein BVX98_05965 [bacterium F11]|nr:hypothetical protein BVX98_05965 [bacterium F11]
MSPQLTKLLKKTSRSFYLSLRVLPKALRPTMGLGYLLCRIADTIADTDVLPFSSREKMLKEFKSLFQTLSISKEKIQSFQEEIVNLITHTSSIEKQLLKNIIVTMEFYQRRPQTDRALLQDVVLGVITGMEMDLVTFGETSKDVKSFQKDEQLEHYLGSIGGEPGRFWTRLCLHYLPKFHFDSPGKWTERGIDFGKGLQMVNILRDVSKDLQMGRCYIPQERLSEYLLSPEDLLEPYNINRFLPLYHELIDETIDRLENGLLYLYSIPRNALSLRAAVWWPLAIGLQTLAKLRDSTNILKPTEAVKIPRWAIYQLMGSSFFLLPSNTLLKWDFQDLAGEASSSMTGAHP